MTGEDGVHFTALGGGSTIGASAYLVKIRDSTVLMDIGVDPRKEPAETFALLCDRARASGLVPSLADVSAVALTHAHTDHCGLLPALYRQCVRSARLKPPLYASEPTKGLLRLVFDNIRLHSDSVPFTELDVDRTVERVCPPEHDARLNYARPELGELRFYRTSHLLGSVMVEFRHEGRSVVYTGDLQMAATPTLAASPVPPLSPDLLVLDGTYAGAGPARELRGWEATRQRLFERIDQVVGRRGVLLLPSFALGRTQDVLALVLEHAEARGAMHYVYLDGQASIVTSETYPRFAKELSQHYLDLVQRNLWRIRRVQPDMTPDDLVESELAGYGAVVIASSGMMARGSASHRWAQALAANPANEIALTGYISEDSREELADDDALLGRAMRNATELGCTSHASALELKAAIRQLRPRSVAIVHCGGGDMNGEGSLLSALRESGVPAHIAAENQLITVSTEGVRTSAY